MNENKKVFYDKKFSSNESELEENIFDKIFDSIKSPN